MQFVKEKIPEDIRRERQTKEREREKAEDPFHVWIISISRLKASTENKTWDQSSVSSISIPIIVIYLITIFYLL